MSLPYPYNKIYEHRLCQSTAQKAIKTFLDDYVLAQSVDGHRRPKTTDRVNSRSNNHLSKRKASAKTRYCATLNTNEKVQCEETIHRPSRLIKDDEEAAKRRQSQPLKADIDELSRNIYYKRKQKVLYMSPQQVQVFRQGCWGDQNYNYGEQY